MSDASYPFRKTVKGTDPDEALKGQTIYFALYSQGPLGEAKLLVRAEMARTINCGKPLDDLLFSFRSAIIESARLHGNPTAPKK